MQTGKWHKPWKKKRLHQTTQEDVNVWFVFDFVHAVVFRQPLSCRGPFLCWERSRTPTSSGRRCEFVVRTALHQIKSDNNSLVSGYQATETAAGQPACEGDRQADENIHFAPSRLWSGAAHILKKKVYQYVFMHSGLWGWNGWEGCLQHLFTFVFLSEAKEDSERTPVERLLRRSEHLPKDPATGSQQGEGVCGQSQSQLQGVGEEPALPCARAHIHKSTEFTPVSSLPFTGRTTWRELWRDAPVCEVAPLLVFLIIYVIISVLL